MKTSLIFSSIALMFAACDGIDVSGAGDFDVEVRPSDWIQIGAPDSGVEHHDTGEARAIIAEVAVGERGSVRFIDERVSFPEGGIGILGQGVTRLLSAADEYDLSPLELFMALAPGVEPPVRLRAHHADLVLTQRRASAVPRAMRVVGQALVLADQLAAPLPEPLRGQETDTWSCSSNDGIFEWQTNFMLWMLSIAGVFELDWYDTAVTSGNVDVLAGAATERWLGACPVSNSHISWMVQTKIGSIWLDVAATSLSLAVDHDVRYYSETGSVFEYRAHITNAGGDVIKVGAGRRTM